jgi:hypothetical protein
MRRIATHLCAGPEKAHRFDTRHANQTSPTRETLDALAGMLRGMQRTAGNQAVKALLRQGTVAAIQRLALVQRTAGNQAVKALLRQGTVAAIQRLALVQPDDNANQNANQTSDQYSDNQQDQGASALHDVAGEQPIELPTPDPVTLAINGGYGPGDYNPPSAPNTLMAKHVGVPVLQRDDAPSQGSDGGGSGNGGQPSNQATAQSGMTLAGPQQAPYQMQVTRTLHMIPPLSLDKLHIDLFQDPQISIGVDSQGTLSAQIAQNLFMLHLMRHWKTPVDLGLSAVWQQNFLPKLQSQQGGQLQAEQHVTKTFSVTWTIQGMRTDSEDGKSRVWSVTGSAGIIKYF